MEIELLISFIILLLIKSLNSYLHVLILALSILKERKIHYQISLLENFYREIISHKDRYGPPIKDKEITKTSKQALQSPSKLPTQNKFTSLTPLTLPAFYPSPSTTIRPQIQSRLISPLQFTMNTPTSLNNPAPKTEKLPFYTPPDELKCQFIEKDYRKIMFFVEPEYSLNKSLPQIISQYYPQGFYYLPATPDKTRLFYEFILVDTDSIDITHTYDKNNNQKFNFSKFKILQVLSLSDWKSHPSTLRKFSRRFTPQEFSYYDYMDAWTNILFQEPLEHSWFIWFKKNITLQFPNWFIKWFNEWGPEPQNYPEFAMTAFNNFIKETNIPVHMQVLLFHVSFGISWITSWTFRQELAVPDTNVTWIIRIIKTKWWAKFNPDLLKDSVIQEWFIKNPKFLIKPKENIKESQFLTERSKFMAELSASSSKKDFLKTLQKALSEYENHEDSEGSSQSFTSQNEDDCYGIVDL